MFLHHKLLLVLDNELNFVTDDIDELSRKIWTFLCLVHIILFVLHFLN